MSPAFITVRTVKSGKRYVVRYRLGGRGYKVLHAGSFKTQKEARLRRDLIAGELAAGRDPRLLLERLRQPVVAPRRYLEWATAYKTSRIDVDAETIKGIGSHLRRLLPLFGDSDPHLLTVASQIEAVAALSAELAPSSVARYWATHRLILDFAGVQPNPARDPAVKLPALVVTEVSPPTSAHVLAMLDKIPSRWRLPLVTIEQTAMAVGETSELAWGDVDVDGCQFRLRRATVKAGIRARARWVQVPEWLMTLIAESCPLEDRTATRVVFTGFTPDVAKNVMARACVAAKIPHYHPHDLRHRRVSLWHGQGVPAKELAGRAGHSRPSMTLDVYSHVMPLDEIPSALLEEALTR